MRSAQVISSRTHSGRVTDDLPEWAPGLLSDRQLWELSRSLDRLKHLGDSFGSVDFSPQVKARLAELDAR
jgi:hypothetical protein